MSTPKTALVVDDEAQLLRLVVRVLERADWNALSAETAADALEIFRDRATEIDLVLLDVNLAGRGGAAELLPELLAIKPELAVVVMSGDALPEALSEALDAAGGVFLRKPFVPRTLIRFLDEVRLEAPAGAGKE
ncbi:MAG: response regulator [Myxococcota bacterium]